jgi:hypothetical protein
MFSAKTFKEGIVMSKTQAEEGSLSVRLNNGTIKNFKFFRLEREVRFVPMPASAEEAAALGEAMSRKIFEDSTLTT